MTPKRTRPTRQKRFTHAHFARWGRQGGATRARRMTAAARHDSALRAGLRRWAGVSAEDRSAHARKAGTVR